MIIDSFDIKLLAELQRDGRLTNAELADSVGLSASQCSRRRAALEKNGAIAGAPARLSPQVLGLDVCAFVQVTLKAHSPANNRRLLDLINSHDEVLEAYSSTGEADYFLKVIVPDLKSLATLIHEVFLAHDIVASTRSLVVLDRLKETSALPLHYLKLRE